MDYAILKNNYALERYLGKNNLNKSAGLLCKQTTPLKSVVNIQQRPVWQANISIDEVIKLYPEENFKKVSKVVNGHKIVLEGNTHDVDETGQMLVKKKVTIKTPVLVTAH